MRTQRKAFTLIEVITALTVLSTIFGTMLLTLHAMQKTSRGFTEGLTATTQQQRFVTQLRRDAHQAQKAVLKRVDPDDTKDLLLELTLANGQVVEYRLFASQIERHIRSSEAIVAQDSYHVAPVLDKGWSLDTSRPFPLLTLYLNQISGRGATVAPTLIPLRINAALRISTAPTSAAAESATP